MLDKLSKTVDCFFCPRTSTSQGVSLMNEVEAVMPVLGPRVIDVLNLIFHSKERMFWKG